jgi:hypothetical protein
VTAAALDERVFRAHAGDVLAKGRYRAITGGGVTVGVHRVRDQTPLGQRDDVVHVRGAKGENAGKRQHPELDAEDPRRRKSSQSQLGEGVRQIARSLEREANPETSQRAATSRVVGAQGQTIIREGAAHVPERHLGVGAAAEQIRARARIPDPGQRPADFARRRFGFDDREHEHESSLGFEPRAVARRLREHGASQRGRLRLTPELSADQHLGQQEPQPGIAKRLGSRLLECEQRAEPEVVTHVGIAVRFRHPVDEARDPAQNPLDPRARRVFRALPETRLGLSGPRDEETRSDRQGGSEHRSRAPGCGNHRLPPRSAASRARAQPAHGPFCPGPSR